jgi:hypothetical protein
LADQIAEALQQRIAAAAAPLRLTGLAASVASLLEALPAGAPLMISPLVVEIR